MAKKRKRKRPYKPPAGPAAKPDGASPEAPAPRTAPPARRTHKEEARRARERAIKQYRRRRRLRRIVSLVVIAAIVAATWGWIELRNRGARRVIAAADAAAEAAGCTPPGEFEQSLEPGYQEGSAHLTADAPGPTYTASNPPTSGPHRDGTYPRDERVHDAPLDQALAVHNLEHAYVIVYYRAEDPGALPDDVTSALEDLAREESKVMIAPFPTLDEGQALAFAAWTQLQQCPAQNAEGEELSPGDAKTIALGFIRRFRGSTNAPEASVP